MSGIGISNKVGDSVPWDKFLSKSKIPQGQTDELLTWLSKVNQKKNFIKSKRVKDIRMEAILECARKSALCILHSKQQERRTRWEQIKLTLVNLKDKAKCECTSSFVCILHQRSLHGSTSCDTFEPKKRLTDACSGPPARHVYDEDSENLDVFLASLSCSKKRKRDDCMPRKRCKA